MDLDPQLLSFLSFLRRHPEVRLRLAAPENKTVVYSGGLEPADDFRAYKLLSQAKAQDPARFDYVSLAERLQQFHAVEFGESLLDRANRICENLKRTGKRDQCTLLWRALSGIYVFGAVGKVRMLVLPGPEINGSVFTLTEVKLLLRADILQKISIDPHLLRDFQITVQAGTRPAPLVVM